VDNQTIYLKKIQKFYFPILIVFYLLFLFLRVKILILLFGLPLFLFFPGYFINKILQLDKYFGQISFFGFSITTSVAFISFIQVLFRNLVPLSRPYQIELVLACNLFLWATFIYYKKTSLSSRASLRNKFPTPSLADFAIAFIPLIFFAIRSFINPYLFDLDGAYYANIFNNIIQNPKAVFYMVRERQEFTYHSMLYHFIAGIGVAEILKFALPAMVWTAYVAFYDFCQKWVKNRLVGVTLYLGIFASSALTTSIDRAKPETLVFLFFVPTLLLYSSALRNKNLNSYLLGLFYAFIAFRSHESGLFLLFAYLIGGIFLLRFYFNSVKEYLTIKNVILFLIIIFPYLLIFNPLPIFKRLFYLSNIAFAGLQFRWWFLNNYQSFGNQLGWPGISFIYFYLYNGVLLLLFLLAISLLKNKIFISNKKFYYYTAPVSILLTIFFSITEVLPRFGIYFLPDRAWVHFFYAGYFLLFLFFSALIFKNNHQVRIFGFILLVLTSLGAFITLCVIFLGNPPVSRTERRALDYINKNMEKKAVIVSTQKCNEVMVEYYTDKLFGFIEPSTDKNYDNLRNQILDKVQKGTINFSSLGIEGNRTFIPFTETCYVKQGDVIIDQSTKLLKIQPGPLSKKSEYQEVVKGADNQYPIYLLYSFAKTEGLLSKVKRQYWLNCVDYENKEFFANLKQNIVYRDKNVLILKIR